MALAAAAALAFAAATPAAAPAGLLAPPGKCAGAGNAAAAPAVQERAMSCLHAHARRAARRPAMRDVRALKRSSRRKSADILRCGEFSHFACGRDFTYWLRRSGYIGGCWRAGENLAWGTGARATPRSIMRAWLRSPGHRRNILGPYRHLGLGLRVGSLAGSPGTHIWTAHFGARC